MALNTYSLNLAAIQDIRKRLEILPEGLDLGPTAADESQSLDVCQRVATFISLIHQWRRSLSKGSKYH
jgi:hypothetical protein